MSYSKCLTKHSNFLNIAYMFLESNEDLYLIRIYNCIDFNYLNVASSKILYLIDS